MITQFFLDLGASIVNWLASLFPPWQVPSQVTGLPGMLSQLLAGMGGLGGWIDWGVVSAAVGVAVSTWIVCLVIKTLRAIASYLPFVGGAG